MCGERRVERVDRGERLPGEPRGLCRYAYGAGVNVVLYG